MRKCSSCGENLLDDAFAWKIKSRGTRQSKCRACHADYRKKHYRANRKKYIAKARRWTDAQRKIFIEFLRNYFDSHPCVDCGETRLATLDFDHVRGKKKMNVVVMIHNGHSIDSVKQEIAKCEVRCANCHRVVTTERAGWWKAGP